MDDSIKEWIDQHIDLIAGTRGPTRDPKRIDRMVELFASYWKAHPDMRFCQAVIAAASMQDPFYLEDDVFEKKLERLCLEGQENPRR